MWANQILLRGCGWMGYPESKVRMEYTVKKIMESWKELGIGSKSSDLHNCKARFAFFINPGLAAMIGGSVRILLRGKKKKRKGLVVAKEGTEHSWIAWPHYSFFTIPWSISSQDGWICAERWKKKNSGRKKELNVCVRHANQRLRESWSSAQPVAASQQATSEERKTWSCATRGRWKKWDDVDNI